MVTVHKSPQPPETSAQGQGQAPPENHGQPPPPTYIELAQPPPTYIESPQPPPTYINQHPPPPNQSQPPPVTFVFVPPQPQLPPPPPPPPVVQYAWSTGLYDCFSDVPNCAMTMLLPCVTFGQIAEIIDQGSIPCEACAASYAVIALLTGMPCLKSCMYRSKMRRQFNLPEDPCNDCCVHFCCELCALCQEYRELQNRGFDMFLGWQGNQEVTTTAPSVHGGMNR